ncbi:ankyrin repeat domain-containing protein 40-like [Plakobranchus ocellatus]|uniref:Ankyrin repeat domain-containing protein 40-like n=1 Tax=Plakobranchus ocellatus TaxID=259542 RepID=A0AAV4AA08_9GAST|nr:ankyrin repeat domain-containing protein 40-like [Plakobranchus ocellatus]
MEEVNERLREAACVGDLNLLSKLLAQGASVNGKNGMNGWTPLHWACKRNHTSVVRHLLQQGADKNITNNDGHMPAQLSSNKEICELLGVSSESQVNSSLPITPNYLANPPFPYSSDNLQPQVPAVPARYAGGDSYLSSTVSRSMPSIDELVLKARLANSDEKDFIEIELEGSNKTFSNLMNLMCAELGVDKNLVAKIRKLPNTIIRKDKDVGRLQDFQELELVLTNKAMSAASRTYCLEPARNSETILY